MMVFGALVRHTSTLLLVCWFFVALYATTFTLGMAIDSAAVVSLSLVVAAIGAATLRQSNEVQYNMVRGFFRVLVNVFFRRIEIGGAENLPPANEPCIFFCNHQNQFVDPLILLCMIDRPISFIAAAISMKRLVIGYFASLMRAIPVRRPQDEAVLGDGMICTKAGDAAHIVGQGTAFLTQATVGQSIMVGTVGGRIVKIESDTELRLSAPFGTVIAASAPARYKIAPVMDNSTMFDAVFDRLNEGATVGIFPEGGSHDQTHLLPLKAGIAMMAVGAVEKYPDMTVNLVPVGLNYFAGHKFRGKVIVEIGPPLKVTAEDARKAKENKRLAIGSILASVESSLRAVTINVEDLETMRFIQIARQLYTPPDMELTPDRFLQLNQRFALAAEKMSDNPEVQSLRNDIARFRKDMAAMGMNANQKLERSYFGIKIISRLVLIVAVSVVAFLPGLILNGPVGFLARFMATREAAKSAAKSTVKDSGRDVVASYKLLTILVAMPVWYFTLSALIFFASGLRPATAIIIILSLPFYSYLGIRMTEQSVITAKTFMPLIRRLLPSARSRITALQQRRRDLAHTIHALVDKFGPQFEFFQDRIVKAEDIRRARAKSIAEFDLDDGESLFLG